MTSPRLSGPQAASKPVPSTQATYQSCSARWTSILSNGTACCSVPPNSIRTRQPGLSRVSMVIPRSCSQSPSQWLANQPWSHTSGPGCTSSGLHARPLVTERTLAERGSDVQRIAADLVGHASRASSSSGSFPRRSKMRSATSACSRSLYHSGNACTSDNRG